MPFVNDVAVVVVFAAVTAVVLAAVADVIAVAVEVVDSSPSLRSVCV